MLTQESFTQVLMSKSFVYDPRGKLMASSLVLGAEAAGPRGKRQKCLRAPGTDKGVDLP